MKKIFLSIFTIAIMLTLCSCEVHFFNLRYDVPWWAIAIPVAIFTIVTFIISGCVLSKKKYCCPNCNKTFNPKWYRVAFSAHINDDRTLKCPHCGKRGLCHLSKDNEK